MRYEAAHMLTFLSEHSAYNSLCDIKQCTYCRTCTNFFTNTAHTTVCEIRTGAHTTIQVITTRFFAITAHTTICEVGNSTRTTVQQNSTHTTHFFPNTAHTTVCEI